MPRMNADFAGGLPNPQEVMGGRGLDGTSQLWHLRHPGSQVDPLVGPGRTAPRFPGQP
jgi:hypothetical protein